MEGLGRENKVDTFTVFLSFIKKESITKNVRTLVGHDVKHSWFPVFYRGVMSFLVDKSLGRRVPDV